MPGRNAASRRIAAALALVLLAAAALGPALGNGFVDYDDDDYLTANPRVSAGLSLEGAAWAFATFHAGNWHPLTWISHQIDASLFGMRPAGHHLASLALHAANGVLLFLLLSALTGSAAPSALVAALFAVHPLHVESVAWASERKDVLAAFFWLLAALAHLSWLRTRRPGRRTLAVSCFALSLLAKPMGVTFPLVLLLLDFWPLGRAPWPMARNRTEGWRGAGDLLPYFVLSAASGVVTWIAQASGGMFAEIPADARFGNAFASFLRYLGKAAWPADLAVFYPHPGHALALGSALACAAAVAGATLGAALLARRLPWLTVGWLWYVATLLPVIGFVQVGNQAMADRYTYLPLTGIFICVAWGIAALARGRRRLGGALAVGATAAVLALVPLARRQAAVWKDSGTLFRHALQATGGNWIAHNGVGVALARAGRFPEALLHLREAVRIQPLFAIGWSNLGNVLSSLRRADAVPAYERAISLDPGYAAAYFNLGMHRLAAGDVAGAEAVRRRLEPVDPAEAGRLARFIEPMRRPAAR